MEIHKALRIVNAYPNTMIKRIGSGEFEVLLHHGSNFYDVDQKNRPYSLNIGTFAVITNGKRPISISLASDLAQKIKTMIIAAVFLRRGDG